MADFDIRALGESWLLMPNNRAARKWCESNLAANFRQGEEGYVVNQKQLLATIDEFIEHKQRWFGF